MRTLSNLIAYEAKKRPDIAELIERAPRMSDEEIDAVEVPLPWYRNALKEIRRNAMMRNGVEITYAADPVGEVREWIGDTQMLAMKEGSFIEIKQGKLLFLPESGGLWFETAFAACIDARVQTLTCSLGRMTKSEYTAMHKRRLANSVDLPTGADLDLEPALPSQRFRIIRH